MTTDNERRATRQLAFAGWIPADDPDDVTSDDEYTPPELVDLVDNFVGGIDLDPCWDPRCFVKPRVGYTKAQDGMKQSWLFDENGKRFWNRWVQPPYSAPRKWIERLAELHVDPEVEAGNSLALIKCDPSTRAWQAAWKADAILFFSKRIPHVQPGRNTRGNAMFPQAMLYFGPHVPGFAASFEHLGVVRVKPVHEALIARAHELVAIDGIPATTYPFLPTGPQLAKVIIADLDVADAEREAGLRCEKHDALMCQACADAITVVDEVVLEPTQKVCDALFYDGRTAVQCRLVAGHEGCHRSEQNSIGWW